MGVAVAEGRHHHSPSRINDHFRTRRLAAHGPEAGDPAVLQGDPGILQDARIRHGFPLLPKHAFRNDPGKFPYVDDQDHTSRVSSLRNRIESSMKGCM